LYPKAQRTLHSIHLWADRILLIALCLTCATLGGWVLASLAGLAPWISLHAGLAGQEQIDAGPIVQISLFLMSLAMIGFLPATWRVLRLENSHRNFNIKMEDVARAYGAVHAADRTGVFTLAGEFDSVRERIIYLREHPDLQHLEPEILTLAAKMSFESRDLALTYSDEKVRRAKAFLQQRQEEMDGLENLVSAARQQVDTLKNWSRNLDEAGNRTDKSITRILDDLDEILPHIGFTLVHTSIPDPVDVDVEPHLDKIEGSVGQEVVFRHHAT
jgi:hypothetical protein